MSDQTGEYTGRIFLESAKQGISGVLVSDGFQVVRTDEDGRYCLSKIEKRVKFISVTVPAGYRAERFYQAVEEEGENDFHLQHWNASGGSDFSFIHISDSETSEGGKWLEEIREYVAHADSTPAFLIHTGDLCHAHGIIWHAEEVGFDTLGIPAFFAIGNHDYLLGDDEERPPWVGYYPGVQYGEELFERRLGPTYYSFEAGKIHFLVLPSLHAHDAEPDTSFADLHEWLSNDLALVPPDRGVIALQHCPELGTYVVCAEGREDLDLSEKNLRAVVAGHWHANQTRRSAANFLSLLTTTPKCGGIDHSPRSFRVVYVEQQEIAVETRIGGVERQLVIAPPVPREEGGLKVVAQVYDTARPTVEVLFAIHREGEKPAWQPMRKMGAGWSWEGAGEMVDGPLVVAVRASLAGSVILEERRPFSPQDAPPAVNPSTDWPVYLRNAAHRGIADSAVEPPLQLAWMANVGGHILHGSPVVNDGRIFVAIADDDGENRQGLAALAGDSGELLWRFSTRDSIKHSPAAGDGLVFAVDLEGQLYALAGDSGELAWERDLGLRGGMGVYEGVICEKGIVYAGSGHGLTALKSDGTVIWQNRDWRQGETCTVTPTLAGGILYASQNWGVGLFAHRARTGELLWKVDRNDIRFRDSSPVECDGSLYVLAEPHLFVLEAQTGEVLREKELPGVKSTATPLIAGGLILCGTTDSGLIALDLENLEEIWRFVPSPALTPTMPYTREPSRGFEAAPVLSGRVVYIGGLDGVFYGLDVDTGKARWQCELGAPILGPAAISGNGVYVADFAGNVYGFAAG
jgi:outer membrane protein assembly factor BamB